MHHIWLACPVLLSRSYCWHPLEIFDCLHYTVLPFQQTSRRSKSPVAAMICDTEASMSCFEKVPSPYPLRLENALPPQPHAHWRALHWTWATSCIHPFHKGALHIKVAPSHRGQPILSLLSASPKKLVATYQSIQVVRDVPPHLSCPSSITVSWPYTEFQLFLHIYQTLEVSPSMLLSPSWCHSSSGCPAPFFFHPCPLFLHLNLGCNLPSTVFLV